MSSNHVLEFFAKSSRSQQNTGVVRSEDNFGHLAQSSGDAYSMPVVRNDLKLDERQDRANAAIEALATMFLVEAKNVVTEQSSRWTDGRIPPKVIEPITNTESEGSLSGFVCTHHGAFSYGPANETTSTRGLKPSLKRTMVERHAGLDTGMSDEKRSVRFGTLETRVYSIALSDHPSCSFGPPISLGWEYQEKGAILVEQFEEQRSPRRNMEQMALSCRARKYLLVRRAGYSKRELKAAMNEVERVKRERLMTDLFLPTSNFDEILEELMYCLKLLFRPRLEVS